MTYSESDEGFKSDGTRVAYLNANLSLNKTDSRGTLGERLSNRLLAAYKNGKIRVIPREDSAGNRLALRPDIGSHYQTVDALFPKP
jgi:phosphoribosylamine--glycine ligase